MFTETISKNKNTGQDIKEALKNIKSDEVFRYYEENTPVGRTTKAKWMKVNNVEGYFPNCRWKLSLVSSKLLYAVIKRNFLPFPYTPKNKILFSIWVHNSQTMYPSHPPETIFYHLVLISITSSTSNFPSTMDWNVDLYPNFGRLNWLIRHILYYKSWFFHQFQENYFEKKEPPSSKHVLAFTLRILFYSLECKFSLFKIL